MNTLILLAKIALVIANIAFLGLGFQLIMRYRKEIKKNDKELHEKPPILTKTIDEVNN